MITQTELKKILYYNPDTGVWTWLVNRANNSIKAGTIAGCLNDRRYRFIKIDNKNWRAARLAWLYMTGTWPIEIDHIDRDPSNDKWENLREATREQNTSNRRPRPRQDDLPLGVMRTGSKFVAKIQKNKKQFHLGTFDTVEEASKVRNEASRKLHKEFAYTQGR